MKSLTSSVSARPMFAGFMLSRMLTGFLWAASIATLSTLVACSDSPSSSKGSGKAQSENENIKSVDFTDRSMCQGPTPTTTTLYSHAWMAKSKTGPNHNVIMIDQAIFTPQHIEMKSRALYKNQAGDMRVQSRIRVSGVQIEVLDSDKDETRIEVDGTHLGFQLNLKPMTFRYSFVGPCLKVEMDGQEPMIVVPAPL